MGFFASGEKKPARDLAGMPSLDFLHKAECRACPLNTERVNSPHMEPTGVGKPLIYVLGEAPGADEDVAGKQFVGRSGRLLRGHLPKWVLKVARWNNVVRTRPPKNRTPSVIEVECCRPSIERDIEKTRPQAIFGFGEVPLKWTGRNGIGNWRGRRFPIQIGSHTCWFYPMYHPSFVGRMRSDRGTPDGFGSEFERVFALDLERACLEVESGLPPAVSHAKTYEEGVEIYIGGSPGDMTAVLNFMADCERAEDFGLDFECNMLRPYDPYSKILSVGLSLGDRSIAFPLRHSKGQWPKGSLRLILEGFNRLLKAKKPRKAVHNLAFELEWIAMKVGREYLRGTRWEDTMSQAQVLDERVGKKVCFGLGFLVQQYFGFPLKSKSSVDRAKLDNEPIEEVLRYNALDAKYHVLLYRAQHQRLVQEKMLRCYQMMRRRVATVVLTQVKGVPVHQPTVIAFQEKFDRILKKTDAAIQETDTAKKFKLKTGTPYNPASSPDVLYMLRRVLKTSIAYDRREEKWKADEAVLSKVPDPIAKLTLRHREYSKLKSTYVDPLAEGSEVLYPDGRLHPILNTLFAETGRLSSEQPNEQNFPKHEHKEIRSQIRTRSDHMLCAFDYGQIEFRVLAMASRDPRVVKALYDRYDVHMEWAERVAMDYPKLIGGRQMLKDPVVMKELRQKFKNQWVFPAFFGSSMYSIAENLELPSNIAERNFKEFWKVFSGVKDWQEKLLTGYRRDGYVSCLTGHRRRAPLTPNQAINAPIQGTTAQIVMDGMAKISEHDDWAIQPIMNIHDDLTFEIHQDNIEKQAILIIDDMLKVPFDFVNVPITVEMSVGRTWDHLEEIGTYSSDNWKQTL